MPAAQAAESAPLERINFRYSAAGSVAWDYTDVKQLKGKRIAIQRLGDLTHIAAREALKHAGLAESDLQMQQICGGPAAGVEPAQGDRRRHSILQTERDAPIKIAERYLPGAAREEIADALDHYNRDLDDRPFPRAEGFKIALELTAQ